MGCALDPPGPKTLPHTDPLSEASGSLVSMVSVGVRVDPNSGIAFAGGSEENGWMNHDGAIEDRSNKPSGYVKMANWKITMFNGMIFHYKWPCSIVLLIYQRVPSGVIQHGWLDGQSPN